jgi:16S rRNA (cytosine967-C5)-methyltransferase
MQSDFQKRFLLSTFLCETHLSLLLEAFRSEWNSLIQLTLYQKLEIVNKEFNAEKIFPFKEQLSDEIDFPDFSLSFLLQPKLFLRVRPGNKEIVTSKLKKANFFYSELSDHCLVFSDNKKVSELLKIDKEAVVQDYNSQKTLDLIKPFSSERAGEISAWDCCAGSGGKSILVFDIFKKVSLTVSDTRKNILENLKARFTNAGIANYKCILADLQNPVSSPEIKAQQFDLIIADVPCSGSGTWARTPEQLSFFQEKDIEKYALLQKKIIENTLPHLKEKGHLLYITCSVFKKENEENVDFIRRNLNLSLIQMEYLKGYKMQADTMFVALFQKK